MGYAVAFTVLCLAWPVMLVVIASGKESSGWWKLGLSTLLTGVAALVGYFILFAWAWSNV